MEPALGPLGLDRLPEVPTHLPAQPALKMSQHQLSTQEHRRQVTDAGLGANSRNSQEGTVKCKSFLLSTPRAERGRVVCEHLLREDVIHRNGDRFQNLIRPCLHRNVRVK